MTRPAVKRRPVVADRNVMGQDRPDEADLDRTVEVDSALRTVTDGVAAAVAAMGIAFVGVYGAWVVVGACLPAIWCLVRRLGLDELFGVRRAVIGFLISAGVGAVVATTATGGIEAPGPYFAGLIALLAFSFFPSARWTLGVGVLVVAAIVAVDVNLGRDVDSFKVIGATVLAVAFPATGARLVEIERTHRAQSVVDPLTRCLNRRSLASRSAELDEQSRLAGTSFHAIAFDLDHFKSINDEHGHATGDRVLVAVADTVRRALRRSELFYRVGGEEFVVLLPDVERTRAAALAESMRSAIGDISIDGIRVTASVGVAGGCANLGVAATIDAADHQLYRAKSEGRDRVCLDEWDPDRISPR